MIKSLAFPKKEAKECLKRVRQAAVEERTNFDNETSLLTHNIKLRELVLGNRLSYTLNFYN